MGAFIRSISSFIGISADLATLGDLAFKQDWVGFFAIGGGTMIALVVVLISIIFWWCFGFAAKGARDAQAVKTGQNNRLMLSILLTALIVTLSAVNIWQNSVGKWVLKTAQIDYRATPVCFEIPPKLNTEETASLSQEFENARAQNPRLGLQTEKCFRRIDLASKVLFENAVVLWEGNPRQFYVIDRNDSKWSLIKEVGPCSGGGGDWCDDGGPGTPGRAEAIKQFKRGNPPLGYFYPGGGVAGYLSRHPDEWSRFGWRKEDCQLKNGIVFSLNFANGRIMGLYPQAHNELTGQVEVLLNDDQSSNPLVTTAVNGPTCSLGSLFAN